MVQDPSSGPKADVLGRLLDFLRGLLSREPVRLAIVRRYADANGSYVGELYMEQTLRRKHDVLTGYVMIGASLDSFPLMQGGVHGGAWGWLDTDNDFLAPMPPGKLRVGSLDPFDNDNVRRMVARMPKRTMTLIIQNRFIEHVMERKEC